MWGLSCSRCGCSNSINVKAWLFKGFKLKWHGGSNSINVHAVTLEGRRGGGEEAEREGGTKGRKGGGKKGRTEGGSSEGYKGGCCVGEDRHHMARSMARLVSTQHACQGMVLSRRGGAVRVRLLTPCLGAWQHSGGTGVGGARQHNGLEWKRFKPKWKTPFSSIAPLACLSLLFFFCCLSAAVLNAVSLCNLLLCTLLLCILLLCTRTEAAMAAEAATAVQERELSQLGQVSSNPSRSLELKQQRAVQERACVFQMEQMRSIRSLSLPLDTYPSFNFHSVLRGRKGECVGFLLHFDIRS
ncbi:unnamed protein product [Closterium sp. NIES-65]|nr:unnamed protein product [Closterium sp. NIES-65]